MRTRQLNFIDELVVDNFAGGGGASTGIERALGRPIDIAINHDPEAIAMHEANHPFTRHYCESVWDVSPRELVAGRKVGLAWFSPDCKHFSKAKGGKPRDKNIRGLAWVAIRWASQVKPRIIMLENVEEFQTWCPLLPDGQPDPNRKGQTFDAFVRVLKKLGYHSVEWRELRACDFGAPTTRKRLFLIARCDGQPISWPEPTHGAPDSPAVKSGKLKPWRTAAECIDWSLPCPSIFEREKPLAEATLRRIAKGVIKYVLQAKEPFIVTCNHSGDGFRGQGINEPFKTITSSRDAHGIVVPTLIQTSYGERKGQSPRVPGLEKPLGTVVAQGQKHALVAPTLFPIDHQTSGDVTNSPEKPVSTVTSKARHAVAVATLIKNYGGNYNGSGFSPEEPMHTVTSTDHHSLVTANLVRQFGNSDSASVDEPVGTIMPGGGGKTEVVISNLVKLYGTANAASVEDPMPTVTATGQHIGEVRAFLCKYYGEGGQDQELTDPMHTIRTKGCMALVTTIHGVDYVIADIGMRMLQPHELFKAQGFPEHYQITPEFNGKPLTKTAQVRMCGNSVSPPMAEALVRANLPAKDSRRKEAV